jgi:deaminated glutathione amidase
MSFTVAVGQFAAGTDVQANTASVTGLIGQAARSSARLVVLPEVASYYDITRASNDAGRAQRLDGQFVSDVRAAARQHGIYVVAGFTEELGASERDSNTLVAVSDTGDLVGAYRKIHLYDAFGYRESDTIEPAAIGDPLTFDLDGITIGAITCYDLRFPEAARWVVDAGAEVILLPAAWAAGPMKEEHWATLTRARAIENTVYVAAADQTGPASVGQSCVIDPMGVTLACAGEAPGIALAQVDEGRLAAVRKLNPSLDNRRFTVAAR